MPIEVSAICEHSLRRRQPGAVRDALDGGLKHPAVRKLLRMQQSSRKFFVYDVQKWIGDWKRGWEWQQFAQGGPLEGPGELQLDVGRQSLDITCGVMWWRFLRDPEVREIVDAAVAVVAGALGANEVIYVPDHDLDISEARDLCATRTYRGIRSWLRKEYDEPARAIGLIPCDPGDKWGGEGYFRRVFGTPLSDEALPVGDFDLEEELEEPESDDSHPNVVFAKPMHVGSFWRFVHLRSCDDEGESCWEEVITALARETAVRIRGFEERLARYLYDLDTARHARNWSTEDFSPDMFLYARCHAVAQGRESYMSVLRRRLALSKEADAEELLSVASEAYTRRTGRDWDYQTSVSYESGSHREGWQ